MIRLLFLVIATVCAIELKDVLGKFLSLLGALLCAPIAIMFPGLMHLVTTAKTTSEKIMDIFLIFVSIIVTIFCTVEGISNW